MKPTATRPTSKNAPRATNAADKPKKRDVDAKMIIETLNALNDASDGEHGRGFALPTIKKYIEKTYGLKMGKARQAVVREVMDDQFVKGNIKMVDYDHPTINFTKRFDSVSEDEDGGDDAEAVEDVEDDEDVEDVEDEEDVEDDE